MESRKFFSCSTLHNELNAESSARQIVLQAKQKASRLDKCHFLETQPCKDDLTYVNHRSMVDQSLDTWMTPCGCQEVAQ